VRTCRRVADKIDRAADAVAVAVAVAAAVAVPEARESKESRRKHKEEPPNVQDESGEADEQTGRPPSDLRLRGVCKYEFLIYGNEKWRATDRELPDNLWAGYAATNDREEAHQDLEGDGVYTPLLALIYN
jgi:hypothetical protein